MAEPIIVRAVVEPSDIDRAGQQVARKITNALDLGARASREHAQRLEQIARVSAAQIDAIERRKQAQLDVIRERGAQRAIEHERKLQREAQRSANAFDLVRSSVGRLQGVFAAIAAIGVVAVFERLGRAAVESAIRIDQQVNSLRALTGSADAAQKRFSALVDVARRTPGLTTDLALTLDTQLRILNVTEQTINKILPVVGKLNAISPLGDPAGFVGNLGQLVTQGFERQDLKELVGRSPFAGELIKEIFNVDSPTNGKAIREAAKKLGIRTVDDLFTAMAQAAENNQKLQAVGESLGAQFEKLRDRINLALAPTGEQLAKILLPLLKDFAETVERIGPVVERVFRENRTEIIETVRAAAELIKAIIELRATFLTLFGIDPFDALSKTIRGAAIAMRFLQDATELTAATIKGSLSAAFLIVAKTAREALEAVGIEITRLNDFIIRTEARLGSALRRGDQGFVNTRGVLGNLRVGDIFDNAEANRQPNPLFSMVETLKGTADFLAAGQRSKDGGKDPGAAKRQRQLTELARAVKETDELRKQVEALRDGTGKLFEEELKLAQLEFEREKLKSEREQLAFVRAKIARGDPFAPVLPGGIELPRGVRATAPGSPFSVGAPASIAPDATNALDAARARSQEFDQRLRIEEIRIQNQVTTGLLSEAEARQALNAVRAASRDEIIKLLEDQRNLVGVGSELGLQLTAEIEQMRLLGVELSSTQRFMRGFNSQIDSVGDAFERFGSNVSRAFTNIRDLFNGLKTAVLQFFNDLLGQSLQNLVRNTLGGIFGNLSKSLGGIFSGAGGNVFRTPSTFGNLAQAFAGAAGGGSISAPPSVSGASSIVGQIARQFSNFGHPFAPRQNATGIFADGQFAAGLAGGASKFSFSALGRGLASAAPFLGLSLGGSIGGPSTLGNILGSAGGALAGIGIGSAFGAITGPLAALGPIGLAAAPFLLVGGFLAGRAKQRRQDEEASGQMLTQALQGIEQLAQVVSAGQITTLAEARSIFENQILGTFRQQINTLNTTWKVSR